MDFRQDYSCSLNSASLLTDILPKRLHQGLSLEDQTDWRSTEKIHPYEQCPNSFWSSSVMSQLLFYCPYAQWPYGTHGTGPSQLSKMMGPRASCPPNFGYLTVRKIITFFAIRCQILELKCTKFNICCAGVSPQTRWGSLERCPDSLANFKGTYF